MRMLETSNAQGS